MSNGSTPGRHVHGRGPLCVVCPGGADLGWEYLRIPLAERELTMAYLDPAGNGDPADQLRAVVDELGTGPVFVVGHASGGFAAQRYALRHPSRVAGLVLYSTSAVADDRTAAATRDRMSELLPAYFADYWRRQDEFRPVRDLVRSPSRLPEVDGAFDVREKLPSILAPTLILTGAHDVFFPPETAETLAAGIPRSRIVTFEQSGHLAHVEEAERFTHVLLEFTRRISVLAG